MHDLAEILKALAWPSVVITALFILLSEIKKLLLALKTKIEHATKIKIGKAGIELAEEISRGNIVPRETRDTKQAPEALTSEFDELCRQYDTLTIEDLSERVIARTALADRLGQIAVQMKLPRYALAEARSEGKLVALATAVIKKPMAGDLAPLEKASEIAKFKFTRYRIVLGLLPILSRPAIAANILRRVETILSNVENVPENPPDESLERLIEKTQEIIVGLYSDLA